MRVLYFFLAIAASSALAQQAPPPNLPPQKLGIDDLVAVSVYDAPELTRTARVEADGSIHLPLLESGIEAAGLFPRQLESAIAGALKREEILVDPVVTVTVAEYHSRPISVVGAVHRPVTFQSIGAVTLLDALAHAEGLTEEAGSEILLTQPGEPVQRIPVKRLLTDADPSVNFPLKGGEEIRIPAAGKIFVVGNVRKPGAVVLRDPTDGSVLRMVALSEGLMPYAAKVAYIYRRDAAGTLQEQPVELEKIMQRKAPDVPLETGDILYVMDNKSRRQTMSVIDRITSFGANTASGVLIWH